MKMEVPLCAPLQYSCVCTHDFVRKAMLGNCPSCVIEHENSPEMSEHTRAARTGE